MRKKERSEGKKRTLIQDRRKQFIPLYIMLIPGIVYLIINNYLPMMGLVIAFKKVNYQVGIWNSPWAGFENFKFLFATKDAWIITRNTLLYNVAFILVNMVVGIAIAILICEIRSTKLKKLYQSAIMLPFLISIVIVSYIVFAFLSVENGMFNNSILKPLGLSPVQWYAEPKYWPFILTFVNIWKGCGYGTLIYIAGIVGIDPSFYEAAKLDGATKWQQITKITLPLLKTTAIMLTIMSVGKIFNGDFGMIYALVGDNASLYSTTDVIDTFVYRALRQLNNLGMSTATSFFQSIVGLVLVFTTNFITKKVEPDAAIF